MPPPPPPKRRSNAPVKLRNDTFAVRLNAEMSLGTEAQDAVRIRVAAVMRVGVCGDPSLGEGQRESGGGGGLSNSGWKVGVDPALWLAPPPPKKNAQLTPPPKKSYRD